MKVRFHERHTKSEKLLPVAFPPMAVKNGSTGKRTILSNPNWHTTRLRPPRLNALAAHTSCPFREVDVISELATLSMAREVEFWHNDFEIVEGGEVECC